MKKEMLTRSTLLANLVILLVFLYCQGISAGANIPPCSPPHLSFNLDFHTSFTGLPSSYGAASGQTGIWSDVPLGTTNGLIDISGSATPVTITLTGRSDTFNPQTTTESILLRDSIVNDEGMSTVAFSASLTGLPDGRYNIYYYSFESTSGLTLNGQPLNDLAGGSADALEAQGTNWDLASDVVITGGVLDIIDTNGGSDGLSGIQIVFGLCCSGDILGDINFDCKVDIVDFSYLAMNWLTCNLEPVESCW